MKMKKVLGAALVITVLFALSSCGTAEKCPSYSHVEVPAQQG
jgi:predicted small lipoprotein YifL